MASHFSQEYSWDNNIIIWYNVEFTIASMTTSVFGPRARKTFPNYHPSPTMLDSWYGEFVAVCCIWRILVHSLWNLWFVQMQVGSRVTKRCAEYCFWREEATLPWKPYFLSLFLTVLSCTFNVLTDEMPVDHMIGFFYFKLFGDGLVTIDFYDVMAIVLSFWHGRDKHLSAPEPWTAEILLL